MKIITLEEHWISQKFAGLYPKPGTPGCDASLDDLIEIGEKRIETLDADGIDFQVLGHGMYPAMTAPVADVQAANDQVAEAVKKFPTRLGAFAALPLSDIAAAAKELERTVIQHGFKGAMINGLIGGKFLDDPSFGPLLAKAEELDVPLYLHPSQPPSAVVDTYGHGNFSALVGNTLTTTAAGWHYEVGLHILRMIVSGTFDKYPKLQVIIGHLGELLPFYWERIDYWLQPRVDNIEMPIKEYFPRNVYVTTSGYSTIPPFLLALEMFGADRMLFSVDYPFSPNKPAVSFIKNVPLSELDRAKISSGNAARLLKIQHIND